MKRIIVLGSSGSIGRQTLDVVSKNPDKLEVVALVAHSSKELLEEQAKDFRVAKTLLTSECGNEAILELIESTDADCVVNALSGSIGLEASYLTLQKGMQLALANKESLVVGGDLLMPLAKDFGQLMPIDSEHGAIYQCLIGEDTKEVTKLWITASGGPFRGKSIDELENITPKQALAHPTWNMGPKITIDSSTLMNKGLEVIEAKHLFGLNYDQLKVVVQSESLINSMVEFTDGSVKAHLGTTDMRIPIQYALSFPDRWPAPVQPLDFCELGSIHFEAPDLENFPCLRLAFEAGKAGGTMPCAMNAANEVAVAAFLKEDCGYLDIAKTIEACMQAHLPDISDVDNLGIIKQTDIWAREYARDYLANL